MSQIPVIGLREAIAALLHRPIRVLRQGGAATQLGEADELSGEDVLPGFTCRVERLLPKK